MNKSLAVFALVMLTLGSLATYSAPPALADWLIDRSGTLIQVDGSILGDDDVTDEVEVETEDQTENQREAEKQRLEKSRETLKNQIEVRKTMQERTGNQSAVELRTEAGKLKLKQEIKDEKGRLIRKQEVEIKDGDSLRVEQESGEMVRINAVKDGRLELIKNRVKTSSDFELKVGEKNEISVTLPNGNVREVSLPDQALERLIAGGVITQLEGEGDTASYELTAGKNGEPVYQVDGQVEKKLLGLFKLKFAQKLSVAAGNSEDGTFTAGDVVESESRETSPWRRFLERMSSN